MEKIEKEITGTIYKGKKYKIKNLEFNKERLLLSGAIIIDKKYKNFYIIFGKEGKVEYAHFNLEKNAGNNLKTAIHTFYANIYKNVDINKRTIKIS